MDPPVSESISYPNPARRSEGRVCFAFSPTSSASIDVYDMLGNKVAVIPASALTPERGFGCWNMKNLRNSLIVPGIYYYIIHLDGRDQRGKLTVK